MATWLNHVVIGGPRNGTTTHTVTPSSGTVLAGSLFTPTAGRLLLCVAEGAVTSTTPSGWTLPTGGSAVANTGLYVWHRTAAGSDSLTTTHNASNYPVSFAFYEFASGSSFFSSAASTGVANAGASPALSSLTGTKHLTGVAAYGAPGSDSAWTVTSSPSGIVEQWELYVANSPTDGHEFVAGYILDSTATSFTPTFSANPTRAGQERLAFAVTIAAGGATPVKPSVLGHPHRAVTWAATR